MANNDLRIQYCELTGDYEIIYKGFSWVSDGRRPYIIIRKKAGNKYISTYRPLCSALKKRTEYKKNSIITHLSGFVAFGKKLDFELVLKAEITG